LVFLVESAWKAFTDTSIPTPQTYLYVHYHGDKDEDELFTVNVRSDGEENLMAGYEVNRREGDDTPVELDVYVTHATNFPVLNTFATEQYFELNIRVAALCYQNGQKLDKLKTSTNFLVKAFERSDYINLAKYLGVFTIPQAAINRDEQTKNALMNLKMANLSVQQRNTQDETTEVDEDETTEEEVG